VIDDGRACALESNVGRWGQTELAPPAGGAVFGQLDIGRAAPSALAAAAISPRRAFSAAT
jgi:hypothetical protein